MMFYIIKIIIMQINNSNLLHVWLRNIFWDLLIS